MAQIKRHLIFTLLLLSAALLFTACVEPAAAQPSPTAVQVLETTSTAAPAETPTVTMAPEPTPSAVPTVTQTPDPTPTPTIEPTPTPGGPTMYSSYADLITFDPETGIAKFDYFDMLRGQDAVNFLVSHEGYTQSAAEEIVENFADSEYVKKNTNPQLRAIDLDDVPLKLMVLPDGTYVDDATPVTSTAEDVRTIYALDANLLLKSYFYYITVNSSGQVTRVEQVYWP